MTRLSHRPRRSGSVFIAGIRIPLVFRIEMVYHVRVDISGVR